MSDAPEEQPVEGEDDVRRRFREALDRKNNARRTTEEHADGKGVGPAVNNTVTRREFRRKSG
jgi:Family of unknown function (DUF5302)